MKQSYIKRTTLIKARYIYARFVKKVRDLSLSACMENPNPIPLDAHLNWFRKHYKEYYIIKYRRNKIGFLRINNGEISISILPMYRNQGYGYSVLKKIEGKAIVKLDNNASIATFQKAGFRIKGLYFEK